MDCLLHTEWRIAPIDAEEGWRRAYVGDESTSAEAASSRSGTSHFRRRLAIDGPPRCGFCTAPFIVDAIAQKYCSEPCRRAATHRRDATRRDRAYRVTG